MEGFPSKSSVGIKESFAIVTTGVPSKSFSSSATAGKQFGRTD